MGPWQNRQTLITSITSLSYVMTRCDFSWFEQNLMSQGTLEWEPLVETSKASMTFNCEYCADR